MNQQLFTKRDRVITTFAVPTAIGYTKKKPIEAVKLVKHGKTLNKNYYPENITKIVQIGSEAIYKEYMDRLYSHDNINAELTLQFGENIYTPWDCLSGIYQTEITPTLGLIARPSGVTNNNQKIIMTDDFYEEFTEENNDIITAKLMATMTVWKAKQGIYVLKSGKSKTIDFDDNYWQIIYAKLKNWAHTFEL